MKFALGEIRMMKDPMVRLLDRELPMKVAWKLNKLVKKFDRELAEIEEFRVNLVRKLGVPEEGKEESLVVPDDQMQNFVDEFNELLNQEVEFEYEQISIEEFGDLQMNAKDMMFLEKIFS